MAFFVDASSILGNQCTDAGTETPCHSSDGFFSSMNAAPTMPMTQSASRSMRSPYWLFIVLILLLVGLQYRLWIGDGSLASASRLQQQIAEQQGENERLLERNRILEAEVMELKRGMETVEERARQELGMLKEGETLYLLTE
jgi:cell division protein FtsB